MKVILTVISGTSVGTKFEFDGHDNLIVGRGKAAHFRLPANDPYFSRYHFLVEVNPPLCRLVDLESRNGTCVNNQEVKKIDLKHGDLIQGGQTVFKVVIEHESADIVTPDPQPQQPLSSIIIPQSSVSSSSPPTLIPQQNYQLNQPALKAPRKDQQAAEIASAPLTAVHSQNASSDNVSFDLNQQFIDPAHIPQQPDFPGYQVIRIAGKGGMGVVYEALRIADQKPVAIKLIHPMVANSPVEVQRFIREADILQRLKHPRIVRFHEMIQHQDNLFFVMDYIQSTTLEELILKQKKPVAIKLAVSLVNQLLDALSYAHEAGFVHRDVKPANLLIRKTNAEYELFLSDFGLSRIYQSSKLSGLTTTGDVGGTTPFMPPEQITNFRNVDPSADQYSTAATLYFMLTLQHVYDLPKDVTRQILMILQQEVIPIESRRNDLPPRLVKVLHKALARKPTDRFPDVTTFKQELNKVLKH